MDDEEAWMAVREGLIVAQSRAIACEFILREVVRDLASRREDPHEYLATLFERISALLDLSPFADEKEVDAEIRDTIGRFFAHIQRQG